MKHTLRFRAYLPDDVASEAWRHIDILRQIRNHAMYWETLRDEALLTVTTGSSSS